MYSTHTLPKQEYFNLLSKLDEFSIKIENLNSENKILRETSENVVMLTNVVDIITYKNISKKDDLVSKIIEQNNIIFDKYLLLIEENNRLKSKNDEFEDTIIQINAQINAQNYLMQNEINKLKNRNLFKRIFNIYD